MVGGGHDLVLSLGLGDGNASTCGLKRGCPKKDGKINNKNKTAVDHYLQFVCSCSQSELPRQSKSGLRCM